MSSASPTSPTKIARFGAGPRWLDQRTYLRVVGCQRAQATTSSPIPASHNTPCQPKTASGAPHQASQLAPTSPTAPTDPHQPQTRHAMVLLPGRPRYSIRGRRGQETPQASPASSTAPPSNTAPIARPPRLQEQPFAQAADPSGQHAQPDTPPRPERSQLCVAFAVDALPRHTVLYTDPAHPPGRRPLLMAHTVLDPMRVEDRVEPTRPPRPWPLLL